MTVGAIAAARQRGMEELYSLHVHGATRLAYLMTGDADRAADLVQDAFVSVFTRFQNLRAPHSFDAYLKRTVVNLARKQWRKRSHERAYLEREGIRPRSDAPGLPDVETKDEVWQMLQRLPHRQRAAIVLRFYEDLSEAQTAELLDCSLGAAKQLVARGMETLRAQTEGKR